jgi:hypothetical protein
LDRFLQIEMALIVAVRVSWFILFQHGINCRLLQGLVPTDTSTIVYYYFSIAFFSSCQVGDKVSYLRHAVRWECTGKAVLFSVTVALVL